MKIRRLNEGIGSANAYYKGELLASRIGELFFNELPEFSKVVVEVEEPNMIFSICFDEVYKETLENLDDAFTALGFNGWHFECKTFNYEPNNPKIFDSFYLQSEDSIDNYLEKLRVYVDVKKYNI